MAAHSNSTDKNVGLAKAVAWPFFALIVLMCFWTSLHKLVDELPKLIHNSSAISIGSLSIKVNEAVRNQLHVGADVEKALQSISGDGIDKLLKIHGSALSMKDPRYPDAAARARGDNEELLRLGLVEEVPNPGQGYVFGVQLTGVGSRTQEFLNTLTKELVREISSKSDEAK